MAAAPAAIAHVKPLVRYVGAYPTAPLEEASAGPWEVNVTVYLAPSQAGAAGSGGSVRIAAEWAPGAPVTVPFTLPSPPPAGGEVPVAALLRVPAGAVELWWPTGLLPPGRPLNRLYALNVTLLDGRGAPVAAASRRVAFRAFALVTADDSDPPALAGRGGSGNLTLRWRVNGANVFARGANWIPLEGLESRNDGGSQRAAVASAVAANMNALRVWGGGVWPPPALLDAADELGVMLYVDAMFASQADSHHFATPGPEVERELRHNVRNIAAHPSLVVMDACNECSGVRPAPPPPPPHTKHPPPPPRAQNPKSEPKPHTPPTTGRAF